MGHIASASRKLQVAAGKGTEYFPAKTLPVYTGFRWGRENESKTKDIA